MGATAVSVRGVSKRFVIRKDKSLKERVVNHRRSDAHKEDFWALRDVSLDIEAGSSIGLVGPNGSGKSTLLKAIGGIIQPTDGQVLLRGRLAALLELGAGFHPDLTGRENVYLNAAILGLTKKQTDGYFDAIVDFSGIEPFIDTQVKFYSSGMYVRLAFAVAVHVDPDILLVDEVLAVGDEPFQRKCMDRIRGFQAEGRTIILVTHSLSQVAEVCDRAVVLQHGQVAADGAPIDALRILRQDFAQTERDDIARVQAAATAASTTTVAAPAGPDAEVTAIRILGRDGVVDAVTIVPGEDLEIEVEVTSREPLDSGWVLGVAVDTSLGQTVFGTNSKLLDSPMPRLDRSRRFRFTLQDVRLAEGSYWVAAGILDRTGARVHRLDRGAQVVVETSGRSVGLVDIAVALDA